MAFFDNPFSPQVQSTYMQVMADVAQRRQQMAIAKMQQHNQWKQALMGGLGSGIGQALGGLPNLVLHDMPQLSEQKRMNTATMQNQEAQTAIQGRMADYAGQEAALRGAQFHQENDPLPEEALARWSALMGADSQEPDPNSPIWAGADPSGSHPGVQMRTQHNLPAGTSQSDLKNIMAALGTRQQGALTSEQIGAIRSGGKLAADKFTWDKSVDTTRLGNETRATDASVGKSQAETDNLVTNSANIRLQSDLLRAKIADMPADNMATAMALFEKHQENVNASADKNRQADADNIVKLLTSPNAITILQEHSDWKAGKGPMTTGAKIVEMLMNPTGTPTTAPAGQREPSTLDWWRNAAREKFTWDPWQYNADHPR